MLSYQQSRARFGGVARYRVGVGPVPTVSTVFQGSLDGRAAPSAPDQKLHCQSQAVGMRHSLGPTGQD